MGAGQSTGIDREYQILARDILQRSHDVPLVPYSRDGIDVPIKLGYAIRTFDVALKDANNRLVVAECKRTKARIRITNIDAFSRGVDLLREVTRAEVAGYYFTKTNYQSGAIEAAEYDGIRVAVCAQDQPLNIFALMFHRYNPDRDRHYKQGQVYATVDSHSVTSLGMVIIRADGTNEAPAT